MPQTAYRYIPSLKTTTHLHTGTDLLLARSEVLKTITMKTETQNNKELQLYD